MGQRDRRSFVVPGQRDKLKILPRDGTAGIASQNPGWDVGRDRVLLFCQGTGRDGILTACPIPEYPGTTTGQKGKKSKKIQFFWSVTSRNREVCPGIFDAALVPGQRDSGTRIFFCPGTKGRRDKDIFLSRDNGTSRPGLSRDVLPWKP